MGKQKISPDDPDFIYYGGTIEAVVVRGRSRFNEYLRQIPGAQYYHSNALFRRAMEYMRRVNDVEGQNLIFRKRLDYGRGQWAKGIFGIIGGAVAAGVGVGALSSSGAAILGSRVLAAGGRAVSVGRAAYGAMSDLVLHTSVKASLALPKVDAYIASNVHAFWRTYQAYGGVRMGINAVQQAHYHKDGWRGIDVVSMLSEAIPGGSTTMQKIANIATGAITPTFEWRPLLKNPDERIKQLFRNKDASEYFFDAGSQAIRSGIYQFGIRPGINPFPEEPVAISYDVLSRDASEKIKDEHFPKSEE
jgi:hypothetical protein